LRRFVALSPATCLQLTLAPIRCIAANDQYAAWDTTPDIQRGLQVRTVARDNPDAPHSPMQAPEHLRHPSSAFARPLASFRMLFV
jgi:hypothetical protein